jgi:hypothetical protein
MDHLKISLLQIRLHHTGSTLRDKERLNEEINWRSVNLNIKKKNGDFATTNKKIIP